MGLLQRHRWFVAAAGFTLVFAVVSLCSHNGPKLTAFADLAGLGLMLAVVGIAAMRAWSRPGQERSFWALMTLGFLLWAINWVAWAVYQIGLHREVPDPNVFDILLFFHVVPMIAAVAWRPDLTNKRGRILLSLLNFLMLLGWWIFLYAFIVFPHQYVLSNVSKYNTYYDGLYAVENAFLAAVLGFAAWTSSGGWRRLYLHFLGAFVLYAIDAQLVDRATANDSYYSGSWYDLPLIAAVSWAGAAALTARDWELNSVKFNLNVRWKKLVGELAMLAILSLPVLGLWTVLFDRSVVASREFRLYAVLAAMLLLGAFVFFRQYLQDQTLMSLLSESFRAYEGQKQLQRQLVQKEKLASLGNLVAGAARDINHPLNAIMSQSEQLWGKEKLTADQDALVRKIVVQATRTRDLISSLLSFAQQAPGEKTPVDLGVLISRATQMLESRRTPGKILLRLSIERDFPQVHANANQLFQALVEVIENAMDALDEIGGGRLEITASTHGSEVVLQFSDNGQGLRDPERVFDPFYTTKPVGKGTGLGLSAVYGVIQDHGGQITCRNKPEGGALFIIKLPTNAAAQSAGAAG